MRLTISSKIKIKIEFEENILNSNLKQENINYFIFGRDCGRYNLLLLKNQFSKFAACPVVVERSDFPQDFGDHTIHEVLTHKGCRRHLSWIGGGSSVLS